MEYVVSISGKSYVDGVLRTGKDEFVYTFYTYNLFKDVGFRLIIRKVKPR